MSIIITFKNEGDEVAKTCKSARETAGDKIDIVLLNDASDDGFDYKASVEPYNVKYYETDKRFGTSLGREFCISHCDTPYFIIMDGHCRFDTKDWYDKAIAVMEKDEDCVYCCRCTFFTDEEVRKTSGLGAYYDYRKDRPLNCVWNIREFSKEEFDVPCVLGANYMCSMRWWKKIDGLKGLKLYGRDEPFISRKSIMMGGKVKVIPQITTLHKMRKNGFPYKVAWSECVYNDLAMVYILYPEAYYRVVRFKMRKFGRKNMEPVCQDILDNQEELDKLRQYVADNKVMNWDDVDRLNNEFIVKMKS